MSSKQTTDVSRGKILVVDDRPENLLAVTAALKHIDAEIINASSGNEALALMLRHQFALVLLDVQMPEMDGFEVASLMRENESTRQVPIIFVTALNKDDAYVFRGYQNGAVDYLFKPLNVEILQAKVQIFLDLERQKRELDIARREADAANLAKSEFLANMSHEIRTPMTAILGFAETLLTEGDISRAPPQRVEAIRTIIRNGEHLLTLINGILDLSRIEAGKLRLENMACEPLQLAREVISLMRVRADAKRLPLALRCIGSIPQTIHTDPTRLRQILINLVGNAIKFTEVGQVRLELSLVESDGANPLLKCDVHDSGIGMTEDQMGQLFTAFTQVDASTTRKFGGTGLGLAISKRLAEMLGGDIAVTSLPQQGSVFSATLATGPLDDVPMVDLGQTDIHGDVAEEQRALVEEELPSLHCRVLLAEDGLDNQRLISFLLEKAGAEVTLAENGQIACDRTIEARRNGEPFDVILMDMQMPVLDGYDATRRVRDEGYHGPIIALTAHAMDGDRQKCLEIGCDDYASKPIDRRQLLALVSKYAAVGSSSTANRSGPT